MRLLGCEAVIPHILRPSLPAERDPGFGLLDAFCLVGGLLHGDGLGLWCAGRNDKKLCTGMQIYALACIINHDTAPATIPDQRFALADAGGDSGRNRRRAGKNGH